MIVMIIIFSTSDTIHDGNEVGRAKYKLGSYMNWIKNLST